jgi:large subunit ribosomal protein L24
VKVRQKRVRPMKVRRNDVVQVIAGKDRGKEGRVIEARPDEQRVIVENLNVVKKHRRPRALRDSSRMGQPQIQPGGVFDVAAPLPVSNVMVVCPTCNRATRVGYEFREEKGRSVKVRVCKRADCGEVLDR